MLYFVPSVEKTMFLNSVNYSFASAVVCRAVVGFDFREDVVGVVGTDDSVDR